MPLVNRPHGKREKRHVWAELTFPATIYKVRQGIFPLREELTQKDPVFKGEVVKIIQGMNAQNIGPQQANNLYFVALDAAIRRRQGKAA